jgi:hypothetical protein
VILQRDISYAVSGLREPGIWTVPTRKPRTGLHSWGGTEHFLRLGDKSGQKEMEKDFM